MLAVWHDVKEVPPVNDQLLLVWIDCKGYALRELCDGVWYDENENYDDGDLEITHWTELPLSPYLMRKEQCA